MPRTPDPAVRTALVEHAARRLAEREPVTARALAQAVGASTMAVYTHFDGMPGLWRAVRQEGFTRLGARLGAVADSDDPVADLAALGAAYVASALTDPHLYRAMFDAAADLEDPEEAASGFARLAAAAARARASERIAADPDAVATRVWAGGHGLVMLVLTGVLPDAVLDEHGPAVVEGACVLAGDDAERCRRSVAAGWRRVRDPGPA